MFLSIAHHRRVSDLWRSNRSVLFAPACEWRGKKSPAPFSFLLVECTQADEAVALIESVKGLMTRDIDPLLGSGTVVWRAPKFTVHCVD